MPSCSGIGEKLPMHPRSRYSRPRLMFQVTNKGLYAFKINHHRTNEHQKNALIVIREFRGDGFRLCKVAVKGIEGIEAMFLDAGIVGLEMVDWVWGDKD